MKPDDSSLEPGELIVVERRARLLLDRASAWNVFPTPVDDLMAAANLVVAPKSMFDPAVFLAYVQSKAKEAVDSLKRAMSKVLGIYDAAESMVHIDYTVSPSKQNFLKLHEAGHHELPTHRKLFRFFQECDQTLAPEIADQFEREANNFARFVLFQGGAFKQQAADLAFGVKVPIKLAKAFGSSIYAAAREYARTHHAPCVVYVLNPVQIGAAGGFRAEVRRVEPSPSFRAAFGCPADTHIDQNHPLASLVPIFRKMTAAREFVLEDLNGQRHVCLGEAFDTTHNILLLIYPSAALRTSVALATRAGA